MLQGEAELGAQIKALLDKAECTDEASGMSPGGGLPAEIKRREDRLNALLNRQSAAEARLEQRSDADAARAAARGMIAKLATKRQAHERQAYKRELGVPGRSDQESFTDPTAAS